MKYMVLGIDINDRYCQMGIMENEEKGPSMISIKDEKNYEIPLVAAYDNNDNTWRFGLEAEKIKDNDGIFYFHNLLSAAVSNETGSVFGKKFYFREILKSFTKKMLTVEPLIPLLDKISTICICLEIVTSDVIAFFREIYAELQSDEAYRVWPRLSFTDCHESFYEYVIHQKEELWHYDVVVFECHSNMLLTRRLEIDRKKRPQICRVFENVDEFDRMPADEELLKLCMKELEGRIVSSVYLTGENLGKDKYKKTIHYLCMKRRVFAGRNLYVKGAILGAADKEKRSEEGAGGLNYLFLGKNKLMSNIGLNLMQGNEEKYVSLADAGISWYDVNREIELYIGLEREIRLLLTPITGKMEHNALVRLWEFPVRGERRTRIRLSMVMKDTNTIVVTVTDLGFGDFYIPLNKVIREEINVV